jgi:hypothetical protein
MWPSWGSFFCPRSLKTSRAVIIAHQVGRARAMVNAAQMVKEKKCQPECNGGVIVCEAIELFGLCWQCSPLQLRLCLGLQYHNVGVPSNF